MGSVKGNTLPRSTLAPRHITIPSSSVVNLSAHEELQQTCFSRWYNGEYFQFVLAWFVFAIFGIAGFYSGEEIALDYDLNMPNDEFKTIGWIAILLGWIIGLLGLKVQLLVVSRCHVMKGIIVIVKWCRNHRYLFFGSALVILAALGVSIWIAVVCPTLANGYCRVVTNNYGWKGWGGYIKEKA